MYKLKTRSIICRTIILFALIFLSPDSAISADSAVYGSKFDFTPKSVVAFPDFEIQFNGVKPGPTYPNSTRRMGDVFQFPVHSNGKAQDVTWSSGTGDIGPSFFAIGKKCFRLELSHSDKIGKLGSDEAVVSVEENDYCP